MASSRSTITGAFLVHSSPSKETDYLCDLLTHKLGRIRCRLKNISPEPYRLFELKVVERSGFYSASDFRYLNPLLITKNDARLFGFYVNELVFKLVPMVGTDEVLFGSYMSTLLLLEQTESIQASLRFIEQRILNSIGRSVDYQCQINQEPIEPDVYYRFIPDSGFKPDTNGRYLGCQILAANKKDFLVSGALSVARECQQMQIDTVLEGQIIQSRTWPMKNVISKNR